MYKNIMINIKLLYFLLTLFLIINIVTDANAENNEWFLRTLIHISSCSTDYSQIKVSVNTKELYDLGKIRSDCGDIRFGDYSNTNKYSYWVYDCNLNGISVFWVNINKTESPCTIYMYYGNPSAQIASNSHDTFVFFDDFSTNGEGTTWIKHDEGYGTPYIDTELGYMRLPYTAGDLYTTSGMYGRNYTFISKVKGALPINGDESMFGRISWTNEPNSPTGMGYVVNLGHLLPNKFSMYKDSRTDLFPHSINMINNTDFVPYIDTWYIIEFGLNATYLRSNIYNNEYQQLVELSYFDNEIQGERPVVPNDAFLYSNPTNIYSDTDWFAIARYNGVEPNYEFGNEEEIEEIKHIPESTIHSLLISNTSWRNILSLVPANYTLIVSDSLTPKLQKFIDEANPDNIYTLGLDIGLPSSYEITQEDIPAFFPNATKAFYIHTKEMATYASELARILGIPLIFNKSTGNFSEVVDLEDLTTGQIKEMLLDEVKARQGAVNYIILANKNDDASLFAGRIAADKLGFPVLLDIHKSSYPTEAVIDDIYSWNIENNVTTVKQGLSESIKHLKDSDMFGKELNYMNGDYLLLIGDIPHIVRPDPVDNSFLWNDTEDGNWYLSDLAYGDTDFDDRIELAVGRYPDSIEDVSLLYAQQSVRSDGKQALIGAEYLHKYWPLVLLYVGGGMWNGMNIETILMNQSYNVTRLVERRSDISGLANSLTQESLGGFKDDVKKISKVVSSVVGKTIGKVVSNALYVIRALEFAEDVLEIRLEYDWDSQENITFNLEKLVQDIQAHPPEDLTGLIQTVFCSIFTKKLPELNEQNLEVSLPGKDIIYYNGVGNGSDWILPNSYIEWDPSSSPYDGSSSFSKNNLPYLQSSIAWDNSNLGERGFGDEFISKGSLSYIGSSAVVYTPYSDELDLRFFNEENTIGQSFTKAVNDFADDWFTWDPVNFLKGDAIRTKMLRSYILLGDPSLKKDPVIEETYVPETENFCALGICMMIVEFSPDYEIVVENGEKSIIYKNADDLLETYKPMLPVYRFDYSLPNGSKVLVASKIKDKTKKVNHVFAPVLVPVSHGTTQPPEASVNYGTFPDKFYRIEKDDGIKVVLSPMQMKYNETAIVHENASFLFIYKTPAEMWVDAKNGTVDVKVKNMGKKSLDGRLVAEVSDGNSIISRRINITVWRSCKGESYELSFGELVEGYYRVRVFLFTDDFVIGPRYQYFHV
jgi:hypothetical protein